jgi:hypothetical protein
MIWSSAPHVLVIRNPLSEAAVFWETYSLLTLVFKVVKMLENSNIYRR